MSEISASAVKELRDRTGAGMMDCKRALQEADGDPEKAIDLLRRKGAARAARRSERKTEEGIVVLAEGPDGSAVLVEATCETDFVARNEAFRSFAERAARTVLEAKLPEGEPAPGEELLEHPAEEPLREELNELRVKIGENLQLRRFVLYRPGDGGHVGHYIHFGDRIGVLVELGGVSDPGAVGEVAREVAMHVAAASPAGISAGDIPEEVRERERRVLEEQAREEGKPPAIVEKIVEGRMRKFFEENALLEQAFVRDPDRSVAELLAGVDPDLSVRRFVRFEVGA